MSFLDLIPGLGNPFGLPSSGVWNLQKGSFTTPDQGTTVFFVEDRIGQFPKQFTAIDSITDGGGRRLAIYEYPYIDGQAVQDLGRKGEKFTMNIKFFGDNYQILFKEFIESVTRSNQKGTLNHPVRGSFTCRFLEWEFVHRGDEWNAVTIKATWIEDNTDQINNLNIFDSVNALLRRGLSVLSSVSSTITTALSAAVALKSLPSQLENNLFASLKSTISLCSQLLGKLAATYSSDAQFKSLFAHAKSSGSALNVNSGTVGATSGVPSGNLPPVYQVGFSQSDQASIDSNISDFTNSSQITPQQAVYLCNQARKTISAAITLAELLLGNDAFSIILQYRILANQMQSTTQGAVTNAQAQVKVYTVPFAMSLRTVAYLNGLVVDRITDIDALNPFLGSLNYVLPGTLLTIPAS